MIAARAIIPVILLAAAFVHPSCGDDESATPLENYPWETCDPESRGLDPQALDSAFVRAKELGFVDCLLVVRGGCIVGERYYNGYRAKTAHDAKSVSKSFLTTARTDPLEGVDQETAILEIVEDYILAAVR